MEPSTVETTLRQMQATLALIEAREERLKQKQAEATKKRLATLAAKRAQRGPVTVEEIAASVIQHSDLDDEETVAAAASEAAVAASTLSPEEEASVIAEATRLAAEKEAKNRQHRLIGLEKARAGSQRKNATTKVVRLTYELREAERLAQELGVLDHARTLEWNPITKMAVERVAAEAAAAGAAGSVEPAEAAAAGAAGSVEPAEAAGSVAGSGAGSGATPEAEAAAEVTASTV